MHRITVERLKESEFFSGLTPDMLTYLSGEFEVRDYTHGEELFHQGDAREAIYLILDGEVDLIDNSQERVRRYVTCEAGVALAETCILDPESPHSLTGRAATDVVAARLTSDHLEHIKEKNLPLYTELLIAAGRLLTRRMANASRASRGRGAATRMGHTRLEHDLLGEREIPGNAYWGVQTLRAVENFDISNIRLDHFPEWIEALAVIKRACTRVNCRLGDLDKERCDAIVQACDEIRKGWWHGHFVVDMIQGGAGTSTNMNINEVLANRALEILGKKKGQYEFLHPNTHVNMSQSTNDVYPSSIKIAILKMMLNFSAEVEKLADSFARKGEEFKDVIKMGRTQLQDAVPMSLGQEFMAWSRNIREGARRIELAVETLRELNIGGTAIGTGINTDPEYANAVVKELNRLLDFDVALSQDLVEETQDTSGFVELAGVFKMFAVRLSKICNDLRLLSSGPRCGINEINLPKAQPGSSIMPGKVNPVIPEVVNQVAFQIIGLDTSVALAAEAGQLELNVFEPLIAFNLFTSIRMLLRAMETLRVRCIDGITANAERSRAMVLQSIGIVTALNPYLGYEKTSKIAQEALETGRSVGDLVLEKGWMTEDEVEEALQVESMIKPRRKGRKA